MEIAFPRSLDDALEELASDPSAQPLAGGTDLMVAINFGHVRPKRILSLRHVDELRVLDLTGCVRCGACVTYARLLERVVDPTMVQAARTVGSPQIRNAGTLGGNLGTCSPAGDTLPVLAALDADIVVRSAAEGERRLKLVEFMKGPKKADLRPGELVVAAEWEPAGSAQAFLKAGTRNAMAIAVSNLAMVVDRGRRAVRVALGSVGPVIIRSAEAEAFAAGLFDEGGWELPQQVTEAAASRFGELCAAAATPIDDVRGTASYRRHVTAVMARRALARIAAAL